MENYITIHHKGKSATIHPQVAKILNLSHGQVIVSDETLEEVLTFNVAYMLNGFDQIVKRDFSNEI